MPLTLDLAQTVAVGPFNPYIITPEWLLRYKVCAEDEAADFFPGMLTDGTAFTIGALEWEVDYRRMMVSSRTIRTREGETCGDKAAKVMRLLNHTPVEAVGHNFLLTCDLKDWSGKPLPQLGSRMIGEFPDSRQFRWIGAFTRQNVPIEVTLAVVPTEGVAVRFNHERRTNPQDCGAAVTAAEQFLNDFRISKQMLGELFQVELIDA